MSDAQVAEVDAYIEAYKAPDGVQPHWVAVRGRGRDWEATWPLVGTDGIASGYIKLESNARQTEIGISVIFRGQPIFRIDIVPDDRSEGNPLSARKYAPHLPAAFRGSHVHAWSDQRAWVREHGLGELPFRRPLAPVPANLDRAFELLSVEINLTLLSDQRGIEMPRQIGFS